MRFRFYFLSVVLAGGIVLSGCKSSGGKTASARKPAGPRKVSRINPNADEKLSEELFGDLDSEQRVEALARFATAISLELNDDSDKALDNFYQAAAADTENQTLVIETTRRLLQANQTGRAIELLLRATKSPTSSSSLHSMLARSYFQAGQTNQAVAAGLGAIKKNPDALGGYQTLAEIYFQANRVEDAIRILNQAARQPKAEATFLISLAETYTKYIQLQPRLTDVLKSPALAVLNRAAALKPQNVSLLQKLADTFNLLGERDKAAEIYLALLAKFSETPILRDPLREKLANIYLLSSDKQRAAELLRAIVRDNPTRYPQAFYVLGTIAFDQKKYTDAVDYFSQAIVIVPDLEQAYYDLAAAQLNVGQPQEAALTLQKAEQKFPRTFVGEFYAGLAAQKLKAYPEAIKHYTTAEVIAKTLEPYRLDYIFYFQMGAAYERNHDYELSEKAFARALELKPNDPESLNYLGYMLAERGVNLDKARDYIEQALKAEPQNGAYLDSMGWVLFKLKQPEQALGYLQKALEAIKNDPILYDHLGDVYSALKQHDKARESWEKSIAIDPSDEVKKKLSLVL